MAFFSDVTSVHTLKIAITLFTFLVLLSCSIPKYADDEKSEANAEAIFKVHPDLRPLWEGQHRDGSLWTIHTLRRIDNIQDSFLETVPTDVNIFCPNYANLTRDQRKYFWTFLISVMVQFESQFDPTSSYEEGFNDSTGNPVISRGLLQISFESSKSYDCGFSSAEQIHNPYMNLACGINILNKWIPADQSFAGYRTNKWRGGARYWSVLRAADKESYNTIVERSSKLSLCRVL